MNVGIFYLQHLNYFQCSADGQWFGIETIFVVTINSLNDKDKSHFINKEYFCVLFILLGSPKEYTASSSDTKPNEHFVLVILSIS